MTPFAAVKLSHCDKEVCGVRTGLRDSPEFLLENRVAKLPPCS